MNYFFINHHTMLWLAEWIPLKHFTATLWAFRIKKICFIWERMNYLWIIVCAFMDPLHILATSVLPGSLILLPQDWIHYLSSPSLRWISVIATCQGQSLRRSIYSMFSVSFLQYFTVFMAQRVSSLKYQLQWKALAMKKMMCMFKRKL